MGIVYKARDGTRAGVALKILAWPGRKPERVKRFAAKHGTLPGSTMKTSSPYEFGEYQDLHFLALEYVEGWICKSTSPNRVFEF